MLAIAEKAAAAMSVAFMIMHVVTNCTVML